MVVDETACLQNAAESIVKGAAYDNNLCFDHFRHLRSDIPDLADAALRLGPAGFGHHNLPQLIAAGPKRSRTA